MYSFYFNRFLGYHVKEQGKEGFYNDALSMHLKYVPTTFNVVTVIAICFTLLWFLLVSVCFLLNSDCVGFHKNVYFNWFCF